MKLIKIVLLFAIGCLAHHLIASEITFTNNSEQLYLRTNTGRMERLKGLTRPGWNITKINPFNANAIQFEMRRCGRKEGKANQYYVFQSPFIPLNFTQATISGRWPINASEGTTLTLQTNTDTIPVTMNQSTFIERDCRSLIH